MRRSLLALALLAFPFAATLSAEPPLQRWALMATDSVADSGLVDLLTVALSKDESLALVERARLREATRELQLSTLVEASRVDRRLQLGRTLRAHALMVLSFAREGDRRVLRVVVCDAQLGVRLWRGDFVFNDTSDVEQLVPHCVAAIAEIRERFAGGVRQIIATPPFLSEDFGLRYEHLQTRYSDLLAAALMAQAGVAVVEIEEARAVLKELQSTLGGGLDRPIATIVKGSYRMAPSNDLRRRRVDLTLELAQGGGGPERIEKRLDFERVGPWLAGDLVQRLLASAAGRSPRLSTKSQMEILSRHAQRFAELGSWRQSTALREAALVLEPNDALQRGLAIGEYQYGFTPLIDGNWHAFRVGRRLPSEARERELRLAAEDYCIGLDHLAYLIRNRLIGRADALGILGRHAWYKPHAVGAALPLDPVKFEALQPACVAQREFTREVYPLIAQLPTGRLLPEHLSTPYYAGRYVIANHVSSDVAFNGYSAESIAGLHDLLTRALPEREKTSSSLLGLFSSTLAPARGDANFDAWSALIDDLIASDRELARLYGKFAAAVAERRGTRSGEELERLLEEVKGLGRADEPVFNVINLQLMRPPAQTPPTPTAPLPRGFGPLGRLALTPVTFVVESPQGVRGPGADAEALGIVGMLQCGEQDVYWSKDRFFVMREPNVIRELKLTDATANHALYWGVQWDGEYIWLHAHGLGIVVIRPDGSQVASFKQQLPGYWKGHCLLGLAPRRAAMVGSFGETNRAWCGLLEVDERGKPSANIFFEAKRVAAGRTREQASADRATAFQPGGLCQVRHADGRQFLLVGRRGLSRLQIDLATLEVSVREVVSDAGRASTRYDLGFSGELFLHQGRVVRAPSGVSSLPNSRHLVFHDGWLYRAGPVWMRERADTGRLERLQASPLPSAYQHLRVGVSAHYGLVAYGPRGSAASLFRVAILDQPAAKP